MTKEDAKRTLQDMWECLFNEMTRHTFEDLEEHGMLANYSEAFEMAMSALSEKEAEVETMEWIAVNERYKAPNSMFKCSECGQYHYVNDSYCPGCGRKYKPKGRKE